MMKRGKGPKNIHITDHAIVKYMQRVQGIDMDELVEHIKNEAFGGRRRKIVDGRHSVANGCRAVVRNMTVVTFDGGFSTTGHVDGPDNGRFKGKDKK